MTHCKVCALAALIVLSSAPASARLLNVPADFGAIQDALNRSEPGDTVLVSPGTYEENVVFNHPGVVLGSLILTTDDPAYIESTIIDGGDRDCVVSIDVPQQDGTATLRGFTIRNGGGEQNYGGGVDCQNGARILLEDLLVTRNRANGTGGGIYSRANTTMRRVVCTENESTNGAGIGFRAYPILMEDCIVAHNRAGNSGGGFSNVIEGASSTATLRRCLIAANEAPTYGAGNFFVCNLTIENCTISGNIGTEATRLGGLHIGDADRYGFRMHNSILFGNGECQLSINSARAGNNDSISSISYCDIEEGLDSIRNVGVVEVNWGEGNIDSDPLFAAPDNGDFHLTANSPCIDGGDPASDYDPDSTCADMGAFFFRQNLPPVGIDSIQNIVDNEDCGLIFIVDLDTMFSDPDGDALAFGVSSPADLGLSIDTSNVLKFTPALNFFGDSLETAVFAFDAEDTTYIRFLVTISPVNDPPLPFALQSPANNSQISSDAAVTFSWEESIDPDRDAEVRYLLCFFLWDPSDQEHLIESWTFPIDTTELAIQFDSLRHFPDSPEPLEWWVEALSGSDTTQSTSHFRMDVAGPNTLDDSPLTPSTLFLSASPNPFNPATTIRFALSEDSKVRILIYDMSGREIEMLVSKELARGNHSVIWNADRFNSGIYLVKMETPSFMAVRKVALIR